MQILRRVQDFYAPKNYYQSAYLALGNALLVFAFLGLLGAIFPNAVVRSKHLKGMPGNDGTVAFAFLFCQWLFEECLIFGLFIYGVVHPAIRFKDWSFEPAKSQSP